MAKTYPDYDFVARSDLVPDYDYAPDYDYVPDHDYILGCDYKESGKITFLRRVVRLSLRQ